MGCNLCAFQKREEHYKLLYEVSQVSAGLHAAAKAARLCVHLSNGKRFLACLIFFVFQCILESRADLLFGGFLFDIWVAVFSFLATPPSDDFLWDSFNILCICCQDVCQVRGTALRSLTVIF